MSPKPVLSAVRRSSRHRVVLNLPMKIGLKGGTLVDISSAGILATHTGTLKIDSVVQISFAYQNEPFQSAARVASCTVVGAGEAEGGATIYASRLFFTQLTDPAKRIVQEMVGEEVK
jgi:hypothetical protein